MINLNVKLEVELDDSFFVDVLETAWRDGVSSWIEKYRFSKRANGKSRAEQIIKDGCIMYVLVDTGREIEETQITKGTIYRGYRRYCNWKVEKGEHICTNASDIDSKEADIIIQLGLFNEIIFD